MSPSAENVFHSALGLPADEQVELIEALIAGLDELEPPPLDQDLMQEVRRRSEEFDAGKATLIPWNVVRDQARRVGPHE